MKGVRGGGWGVKSAEMGGNLSKMGVYIHGADLAHDCANYTHQGLEPPNPTPHPTPTPYKKTTPMRYNP